MRMGSAKLSDWSPNVVVRAIDQVYTHPDYISTRSYLDVALAYTKTKIEFSDYVLPICLNFKPVDDKDHLANTFAVLAGWGLDSNFSRVDDLSVKNIRINPTGLCESIFSPNNLLRNFLPPIRLQQQVKKKDDSLRSRS